MTPVPPQRRPEWRTHLMIESAARAERYELQSSASPFYLWEVPQKPVSARIPFPLIDRLEHEAVESFRSLSSRGSEVGGILLGKVLGGSRVLIQDYEMVPCDYSRGPLYRLSEADTDRFDRLISQRGSGGLAAIGFFRSHTRKGLALDPEDVALFDSRFSAPHHIVLLIRPFASKPSAAGIFIRENGVVRAEASYKEFPFRCSELTPSTQTAEPAETEPLTGGLATALPPPAVPKSMTRAQIVPIASRRESAAAPPPAPVERPEPAELPAVEPEPSPPVSAMPAAPAPASVAPPMVEAPVVEAPAFEAPVVEAPVYEAPVYEAPVYEAPVYEAPPKPAPEIAEPVNSEIAPATELPEAEPAPAAARNSKFLRLALAAAAGLIVIVGLFVYPGLLMHRGAKPGAPASQDTSSLALRVQHNGGEILLTWNRDSDAVRNATRAVLSISDGDRQENVDMDVAQLRIGVINYTPATSDVVFKMEVTGQGQSKTTSESIRALQMRPSPMPQPGQEPQSAPTGATKPAGTAGLPAEGAPAEPNAEEVAPKVPDRVLRPFRAESLAQRLRPATPAELPDAPSMGGVQTSGSAGISGLNFSPSAPPPAAPAKSSPPPVAPPKAPVGGNIVQAQPLRRKDPDYPKIARDAGAKGIVELQATIGVDGRVKSVKVLSGHPMLQKAAQDAVVQWIYTPALLNGVPVEAPVQVRIDFKGR